MGDTACNLEGRLPLFPCSTHAPPGALADHRGAACRGGPRGSYGWQRVAKFKEDAGTQANVVHVHLVLLRLERFGTDVVFTT